VDFEVSEEQQLLLDTVGQYIANECPPTRLREIFDSEEGHDPALWQGFAEIGMTGLHVSERYGGAGLEMIDLALAMEAVAYGGMPGPFLGHALACLALEVAGSDEQKERWLPRLASGELLGSVALGEMEGVWQPEQWTVPAGETLSGSKAFVPYGSISDLLVVGTAGPGLALAERGAAGVEVQSFDGVDRARRLDTVVFEGTPCEMLPEGKAAAPRLRDAGLCLLAADAYGTGKRLVEMSVAYAKEREQFGVTIGHFQALKHQLANMALEIEPARGLYWYAAHAFDHIQEEAERAAALAKAHITDRTMQIARDAVEVHGGIGFTWECDVQIWFKRAIFDRAFLGMPSVHRDRAADLAGW
jgi:alkylation response protein AidB-like acyl-CoA dehydrogenase